MYHEGNSKNVIIVGAGPAGLTAAYRLLKARPETRVLLFEETALTGGISTTIEHNGNRIDIGGHRFFSKSPLVNALWRELLPTQGAPSKDDAILGTEKSFLQGGPDPEKTDIVMLIRERVSRIFYRRRFFDYPISISTATFINMGLLNTVVAGFSYLYSSVFKRDEKSLEDFYINRFGKKLYKLFFEHYTEKVWGVHPSALSASWGAQRVKTLSLVTIAKEMLLKFLSPSYQSKQTSLIERFHYPKLGPGQLWAVMAQKVAEMAEKSGGGIFYNAAVTGLSISDGRVTEVEVKSNGASQKYPVEFLFSTMPVKDLVCAMGSNVPEKIGQVAANLPYRDFITVGLLVKKLRLKNKTNIKTVGNIVPDCWIYIQERDVKIGRLQIFNNWSPYMVKDFQNTVWIGLEYFCNEGDDLWGMDREKFISFAIDELVKIDIIERGDVLDANQVKVKKAYPAYFGAYDDFPVVREYLDGVGNLFCIGRNGQHKYNNMDHSMLTAVKAVEVMLGGEGGKSAIWDVNTEEEYHESQNK
ncbi:MAG: NAD(P)/FAD-dependent oxidoreductase [Puniceicoccales bacterium]|jgi:protoporphyrinogen oxidase|nr:NAD(P)/FAD-dependent oxidoreductase [Puniceicoccales bacterium]